MELHCTLRTWYRIRPAPQGMSRNMLKLLNISPSSFNNNLTSLLMYTVSVCLSSSQNRVVLKFLCMFTLSDKMSRAMKRKKENSIQIRCKSSAGYNRFATRFNDCTGGWSSRGLQETHFSLLSGNCLSRKEPGLCSRTPKVFLTSRPARG